MATAGILALLCAASPALVLGADNNLLSSDFKGMNNVEGDKKGTIAVQ